LLQAARRSGAARTNEVEMNTRTPGGVSAAGSDFLSKRLDQRAILKTQRINDARGSAFLGLRDAARDAEYKAGKVEQMNDCD
jgi:hypothetical protein